MVSSSGCYLAMVSLLIDPCTRPWQFDMIQRFFSLDDAKAILSIPLNIKLPGDRLVWAYTPKVNFTVRSAYKLAVDLGIGNTSGGASNVENAKIFWKTIWRLNIPNKVKSFAWKANKNILPTKANLCRRKVLIDLVCEACEARIESSARIFSECDKAREVWQLSGLTFDTHRLVFPKFVDWLWHLKFSQRVGDDTLELVLMIAWKIWYNLYNTPLRYGRMHMWLDLDPISGMVVSKGRGSVG